MILQPVLTLLLLPLLLVNAQEYDDCDEPPAYSYQHTTLTATGSARPVVGPSSAPPVVGPSSALPAVGYSSAPPAAAPSSALPASAPAPAPAPASTNLGKPDPMAPVTSADFHDGYFQPATNPHYIRNATCTQYSGCTTNGACGFHPSSGFTAALSQYSFGAGPGGGAGGACGRCFRLQGWQDPWHTEKTDFPSIVVKVTNLCPVDGNSICGQSVSSPHNYDDATANFDICQDSGAAEAFFPADGSGMLYCAWQEVKCSEWKGSYQNTQIYEGGCLAEEPELWPSTVGACSNNGSPPK